jgi:hypothetical protein
MANDNNATSTTQSGTAKDVVARIQDIAMSFSGRNISPALAVALQGVQSANGFAPGALDQLYQAIKDAYRDRDLVPLALERIKSEQGVAKAQEKEFVAQIERAIEQVQREVQLQELTQGIGVDALAPVSLEVTAREQEVSPIAEIAAWNPPGATFDVGVSDFEGPAATPAVAGGGGPEKGSGVPELPSFGTGTSGGGEGKKDRKIYKDGRRKRKDD